MKELVLACEIADVVIPYLSDETDTLEFMNMIAEIHSTLQNAL